MVQSSPPKQLSINMYKYLRSLNVLNNFTIKLQFASYIISFSDMICCCWRVSTICAFFICFNANERELSEWICTNSTRPKPPTPSVDRTRKSVSCTSRNSSLILNGERKLQKKKIYDSIKAKALQWNAALPLMLVLKGQCFDWQHELLHETKNWCYNICFIRLSCINNRNDSMKSYVVFSVCLRNHIYLF